MSKPPLPGEIDAEKKKSDVLEELYPMSPLEYFDELIDVPVSEKNTFRVYKAGNEGITVVFVHGAGCCAMNFALVAMLIKSCTRVIAIDMRGHGDTHTSDDLNMNIDVLSEDVTAVINMLCKNEQAILLVGHSLGGSVVIRVGASGQLITPLRGLFVIDVVEGTALESLPHMDAVLSQRPPHFPTLTNALRWVNSNMVRNRESVAVSGSYAFIDNPNKDEGGVVWKLDLSKTKSHWKGWYVGMNQRLLGPSLVRIPKVIIVAGADRLDKDLSIGHMQGKFQLNVIPNVGHCIHEEVPDTIAKIILNFINRYTLYVGRTQINVDAMLERAHLQQKKTSASYTNFHAFPTSLGPSSPSSSSFAAASSSSSSAVSSSSSPSGLCGISIKDAIPEVDQEDFSGPC